MLKVGCTSRLALAALAVASIRGVQLVEIRPNGSPDRFDLSDFGGWKHDYVPPLTYGPPRKGKGGKIRRW